MTPRRIGVGVPVWRGASFVAETLQCVLAQRDVSVGLFVSIDGGDLESERACRAFASDPRVRLVVQPRRLGWVQNSAVVLAGAAATGAAFVCLQPHDDLIEPDYLRLLFDTAAANPQAAVVYSDIISFGDVEGVIEQPDVIGSPVERQVTLLAEHYNAIAYRGVTRVSALAQVPPISGNHYDDFASDSVWMARLARTGDLLRVPRPLYRKRYHSADTHRQWTTWPVAKKIEAWLQHCLDMLAEALSVCASGEDIRRVVAVARSRVVLEGAQIGPFCAELGHMGHVGRSRLHQRFDEACVTRFSKVLAGEFE